MSRLVHRHRRLLIVGAASAVLLVAAAAAAGLVSRGGGSGGGSASGSSAVALPATLGSGSAGGAAGKAPATADGQTPATPGAPSGIASDVSPLDTQRFLVRTGDMSLTVGKGGVPQAAARVVALTSGFGGYVLTSQVSSADGSSAPFAALSVRVPAPVYDTALRRFGALGHVQSVQTSATDVTSRSVDLNARLAQARRVDRRLLGFLARATTVSEALAVQTRIDATELMVEELSGQLKALHQQVAYGTLAVSIAERAHHTAPAHRNSFLAALSSSWRHLTAGFAAIVVGFGVVLPFVALLAALALVAWYGARVAARWRRSRPGLGH